MQRERSQWPSEFARDEMASSSGSPLALISLSLFFSHPSVVLLVCTRARGRTGRNRKSRAATKKRSPFDPADGLPLCEYPVEVGCRLPRFALDRLPG